MFEGKSKPGQRVISVSESEEQKNMLRTYILKLFLFNFRFKSVKIKKKLLHSAGKIYETTEQ
uniref:Uncharacterized protein n=1 Tax=Romanomermis culicivorax TaxID=13658 RepID=A0A915IY52_ROMCU